MSTKETLIKFLKGKATAFTHEEVVGMIGLISQLEDPKPKEAKTAQPKDVSGTPSK